MPASPGSESPGDAFEREIRAARDGSAEALGRILEWFRPYLLRIANEELDSGLRPKVGPSDLVQQTFIEAQRGFAGFRGAGEPQLMAWLRGILLHNVADTRAAFHEAAKRQIKQEQFLDAAHAGPLREQLTAAVPAPLDRVIAEEEIQGLRQALDRLPQDYRCVLRLHHEQGQSFVEIGAVLGRSADAVRKLWFRAVEALRKELRDAHGPS